MNSKTLKRWYSIDINAFTLFINLLTDSGFKDNALTTQRTYSEWVLLIVSQKNRQIIRFHSWWKLTQWLCTKKIRAKKNKNKTTIGKDQWGGLSIINDVANPLNQPLENLQSDKTLLNLTPPHASCQRVTGGWAADLLWPVLPSSP